MQERLTERAGRVIRYAEEAVRRQGGTYISTEHLLLGLLREEDNLAVQVLRTLEVSPESLRMELEAHLTPLPGSPRKVLLSPRGQRVIDLAYNEARQFSHRFIGAEHLLLGLLREREGLAGRLLAKQGVALDKARKAVEDLLQTTPDPDAQSPSSTTSDAMQGMETPFSTRYPRSLLIQEGEPIGQLVARLEREHIQHTPGLSLWFKWTLLVLSAWGTWLLLVGMLFEGRLGNLPFLVMAAAFTLLCASMGVSKQGRETAHQLAACDDVRVVATLIDLLIWSDKGVREAAIIALTRLLPRVPANYFMLTDLRRFRLYTALNTSNVRRHPEFVLAILKALEQIGDDEAIPHVTRMANLRARTARGEEIRSAARTCLEFLHARTHYRHASLTLLRPTGTAGTPPETLLRPATARTEHDPASLLRPGELDTESPTAEEEKRKEKEMG